jgi:hypothetical protein
VQATIRRTKDYGQTMIFGAHKIYLIDKFAHGNSGMVANKLRVADFWIRIWISGEIDH